MFSSIAELVESARRYVAEGKGKCTRRAYRSSFAAFEGGCYLEQAFGPDGSAMPLYCGNGIAECGQRGASWSFGERTNVCLSGTPVYVDGGPDGALCCANALEKETEAGDPGADGGASAAADASAE
jgi:hypothetical protein